MECLDFVLLLSHENAAFGKCLEMRTAIQLAQELCQANEILVFPQDGSYSHQPVPYSAALFVRRSAFGQLKSYLPREHLQFSAFLVY